WIAEAAAAKRYAFITCAGFDIGEGNRPTASFQNVERDRWSAILHVRRAVDSHQRTPTRVLQPAQAVEQVSGESHHVGVQPAHADFVEKIESLLERGDAEERGRPVLEGSIGG